MFSDPVADMLTRIKNGYQARLEIVKMPYSKIKEGIGRILVKEGYLKEFKIEKLKFKILKLALKYEGKKPVITEIKRISKPGLRVYSGTKKIPKVKRGFGITIVSTPKGLLTDKEARKKNLGGEVICQIW